MENNEIKFCALESPFCDYDKSAFVVLPMPFEGTVSYGKGTSNGPEAIIKASQNLELYDEELDCIPAEEGVFTAPVIESVQDPNEYLKKVEDTAKKYVQNGKFIVGLGGEHSVTQGIVKALKEKYSDLSVLQLDAHSDLRDEFDGTKFSHACVMKRIHELECKTAQVGIRSMDIEEADYIKEKNISNSICYAHQLKDNKGNSECIRRTIDSLSENVFITIDLDVFDPSIMPSTGTPEPGGMLWYEVLDFLKVIFRHKNIVGFDIVELAPIKELHAPDFMAAKLVYKLMAFLQNKDRL